MRKIGLFLLFISCFYTGTAQYTELINSRRPGFSDSPFSVGTNVYQAEAGLFYKNIGNYLFFNQETQVANAFSASVIGTDISLRAGLFLEKLEFNLDLAVVNEKRNYTKPTVFSESAFGLGKLTVGAKYLIYRSKFADKSKEIRSWKKRTSYDWKRLIPSVAVYAGLNTNLLTKIHKNPDGISPRIAIFTQNDLTNRLVLITNFISDKLFTDERENSYIITGTYSLNEQWSAFVENQGFLRKKVPNDFQFGGGVAYLLSKNMQIDASVRSIIDERGDDTFLFGAGLAWRLDKHKDQFKMVDSDGKVTKNKKEGNFFSRLFGSKKDKKQRKVKKVKAKKRKIKELKPKKSKKQKRAEKEAKKKAKEARKKENKKEKDYDKNYEPPKDDSVDDNN